MAAGKNQSSVLHPLEQAPLPEPGYENEAVPGLGRSERYLKENRVASGNIADDPTESGEPVRNRKSFANLKRS